VFVHHAIADRSMYIADSINSMKIVDDDGAIIPTSEHRAV